MHINPNLSKKILAWYDNNKRSLPWRVGKNSKKKQYYRLLSEFMLQQTQVKTVIPYFNKFTKKYRTLRSLSKSSEKEILKLWEGLGYYRRAKNLLACSKKLVKEHNSKLPKTLEREVDFLYKVKTKKQEELLLHLEFQSHDNAEMLERMQEYHGIIYRKYRLPIQHIVIYLGKGVSKMRSKLPASEVFTGFELININEIDVNYLLNVDKPEVIILALLKTF